MINFEVEVPFAGESLQVFKQASDLHWIAELAGGNRSKCEIVDDETAAISLSFTLGVFRLVLDGQCIVVDRDYDSQVSIFSLVSKDRGGNGKLDATIRLSVNELQSLLSLDFEVATRGMLARVDLPAEEVIGKKIESILSSEFGSEISVEDTDTGLVQSLQASHPERFARPSWLVVLQFPGRIFALPLKAMRKVSAVL